MGGTVEWTDQRMEFAKADARRGRGLRTIVRSAKADAYAEVRVSAFLWPQCLDLLYLP